MEPAGGVIASAFHDSCRVIFSDNAEGHPGYMSVVPMRQALENMADPGLTLDTFPSVFNSRPHCTEEGGGGICHYTSLAPGPRR